jgi:MoaA/NifB/PqqE/SkfB family radical SAM enzyme
MENVKEIVWQVTNSCNYNCSYCMVPKGNYNSDNYQETINKLKKLNGLWNITISGGEPFVCKNFKNMIKGIINETNHNLVIITNFSYPIKEITEIIEIAKSRLKSLIISLHLEYVKPEEFLKKTLKIKKYTDKYGIYLQVNCVGIKEDLERRDQIGQLFCKQGIKFNILPNKFSFNDENSYSEKEKCMIKKNGETYGLSSTNFQGKKCLAGKNYFVINEFGDAYRCFSEEISSYSSKSIGKHEDKEFKLYRKAKKCPYTSCTCEGPYYLELMNDKNQEGNFSMKISAFKKTMDRNVGRIGIFIKKKNPSLYYKIKKIKDKPIKESIGNGK